MDILNKFFGRTEILSLLRRRVIDLQEGYRQNTALIGNKYVGKSSTLQNFASNIDDNNIIIIYLDLEDKDFSYFFKKFAGSLLYNYSKSCRLILHEDLNLQLEATKNHIPNTVQVIKKINADYLKGKKTEAFLGLLTLPEIFTNETGKYCVLIIDEFQNLEDFCIPEVFQILGKKIMTQKRCFYVISSSYPGIAEKILSEKLSLLFGNFETIKVEHFDLETSQQFVEHSLEDVKIGVQLRNFLMDFTGGHPLYLDLICKELKSLCAIHKQNEIYMPILSQSIENTIFNKWGVISRHFDLISSELCSGKGNNVISSVLMSLSNGKHKINDLLKDIDLKKSQLTQKLNRLLEVGIIIKNGNFHYFKDKLFKYWIKYVYQRRIREVDFTYDKQRKQFKEEFNRSIENFKIKSRQDFSSRIIELFYCFDNEAFYLNGRKYKMPLFKDITPFKLKSENGVYFDVIKASSSDSVWVIVLKKDTFCEGDVNIVLKESRKIVKKPDRCLIISLTDLEENARLKALQERFWIWNKTELNVLLTLYDKPYILR